jgi:predicted patatin/cPLA2 family phospholipase
VVLIVVLALAAVWIYPILRFPGRMEPVPADKTGRAEVAGLPGVRYRVAEDLTPFVNDVLAARVREKEFLARSGKSDELPPMDLLAVSGGGDKGAFGAGLLCGWTEAGDRPTFKGVTGVSTGALIAPFAFLGPEYDHVLRTVYTAVSQKDIALARNFLAAITDDGMADNRPLWTLISKYVNEGFLARIAEEDAKGRLLLIGTTDLDSREPVIWNMGKIAAAPDHKKALELFRNILLASAAIPGAFPPTMIEVEVDGKKYEEMHVDGGASAQVFLYPPSMSQLAKSMEVTMRRPGRVFIIRNSLFRSDWARVERRTLSIANRAISSLIHTQGIGDLYRIYSTTQQDGLEFNLAYVDDGFQAEHTVEFDPVFMKKLFGYGFELARKGYPWKHAPPGMTAAVNR